MVIFNCDITIGKWRFDHFVDLEITSNIDSLTDTCRLTFPRRYQWEGKNVALGDEPYIRRKDKVVVKLGYDGNYTTEFIGYVKEIKAGLPVTIECEDSMFLLKQKPIEKLSLKAGMTLEQWLNELLPADMKRQFNVVKMGALRVSKKTPAEVLDWIKGNYGLQVYFRLNAFNEPVLHCGFAYSQLLDDRRTLSYQFGDTIVDPFELTFRREEDVRLRVKAIGIMRDNTRKEIELGDADGEIRTLHYYNVDLAALKQRAEEDMKRLKFTGYTGQFTTYGAPSIKKGDIAHIIGNQYYPDGKYLVGRVTKQVSLKNGYKQIIEPHRLVNES